MTELIFSMIFWLLLAMVLGLVVAWLFAKVYYKRREKNQADDYSASLLERNNLIDKLKNNLDKKKLGYEQVSHELDTTKATLASKSTQTKNLQNQLNSLSTSVGEADSLKRQNNLLNLELERVKNMNEKISDELAEFETVLMRAEEKLEENEKSYQQIIRSLDKEVEALTLSNQEQKQRLIKSEKYIATLEEDLKLYHANNRDPEFIITKDQFMKIEEQLKNYQEEINQLKEEKDEAISKKRKTVKVPSTELAVIENKSEEKSMDEPEHHKDDSSMVRVFRDTYKKITKS